jgi:glycine dehydrogenase
MRPRELKKAGFKVSEDPFFDTFTIDMSSKGMTAAQVQAGAVSVGVGANVRIIDENTVGISMGEGIGHQDLKDLLSGAFGWTGQR